jgi:RNA polymerase sigma-70 factor (ECF subfamily)
MTAEEYNSDVQTMRPLLIAQARQLMGNGDEAEDVVQDVLLRLWQMVSDLHRPILPLSRRLVRNMAIDRLRRRKPMRVVSDSDGSQPDETAHHERMEQTMHIVEQLPALQQTLLRLRHMEGMEMADIAQLTGTSEAAVRQALSRARRAVLRQYEELPKPM